MSVPVVKVSVLTTPPSLKLKLLPKPVVQVKMLSRFPANIAAISPVLLDRTGGNYTFSIDLNEIIANLPPAGVSSVFGRAGAVTAQSGDYTFAQIGSKPTTLSGYGITDAQPLDSDLTALAGNSTNGLWSRTGSGTGSARTITGTANAISVTNGDGVSGNPTLAISSDAALPGNPTTTTQAVDNSTTRIATTAYVIGQAASATPLVDSATAAVGSSTRFARADHVHPGRERLAASRTYYVRSDGNDSNTGLVDSAGGAFLTIQRAINIVFGNLDLGGNNVSITVRSGTFAGIQVTSPQVGAGTVTITGDTTTPSNVLINASGNCVYVAANAAISIQGFKFTATSGVAIGVELGGQVNIVGKLDFGACGFAHMSVQQGGFITGYVAYNVTGVGAGQYHMFASTGGIIRYQTATITLSGTLGFGVFAFAEVGAILYVNANTYTGGTITGQRYAVTTNAIIHTNGGGASYFPGNSAGGTTTGGVYT